MQYHQPPHQNRLLRLLTLSISLALLPLSCIAGSEVYPGGFTVSSPGTEVLSLFLYKRKLEGYYIDGKRLSDSELEATATVLAYTNYGQTAGMPSSWNITLPNIDVHKTSGTLPYIYGDNTSGLSDLRIAYTFWPLNDPDRGRSLAIASTLHIPTADYNHSQILNTGENRWQATFQLGWIQKLSPTFTFEFAPEVNFYSTNHNYLGYVMTQKPSYAATTYLRWRFLPTWESNVGFQANGGGEQNFAGYPLNNQPRQQRVFLGVSTALSQNIYTGLHYSRDTSIDYELKTTSNLVLSMHYIF